MMATTPERRADRLLAALPAIYQEDSFLAGFLDPFEQILLGGRNGDGSGSPGLEETIDRLHELFDPERAPERFLPWLAQWVGIELPEALDVAGRRRLIAAAVELRRLRGTRAGLERILAVATGTLATVAEPFGPDLQIGIHSTIGVDTYVEGIHLGDFHVELSLPRPEGESEWQADERARDVEALSRWIIERERPVHTRYTLTVTRARRAAMDDAREIR